MNCGLFLSGKPRPVGGELHSLVIMETGPPAMLCCTLFGGPHLYLLNRNGIVFIALHGRESLLASALAGTLRARYRR